VITTVRATRSRLGLTMTTLALVAVVLAGGAAIERVLASGRDVDFGLMQLRLTYNRGVGFSLGADLPTWTVLAVTGAVTLAVAIYAWLNAPTAGLPTRLAMASILAGALANVFDRMVDGHVTDYLHTGWFPTFNLADILVSVGAALFVITTARDTRDLPAGGDASGRRDASGIQNPSGTGGPDGESAPPGESVRQ
jgi:signal peptidase II